jgi:hypothetical protein
MHIYQYADGQNIDEFVYNMIEKTSQLLTKAGFANHIAIGFDVEEADLSIIFKESADIKHVLTIADLPERRTVSQKAKELYEKWEMPRSNVISFLEDEIDQLLSSLCVFSEQVGYS